MQFKIKTCAKVSIRQSFHLKCSFRLPPILFLSRSLSLLCALVHAIERETRAGYYSLCIAGHDKIHGLSCTLGTTRVIQSPGSGSFELIMGNICSGCILGMRRYRERDDKYFVRRQFGARREPNRKTWRSCLDEPRDVRSAERSVST